MKMAWILVTGILALPLSGFAEPAKASKNDFVRAKPFANGKVVMSIKAGQIVDIQKREGSWYLVKVGAKTGWAPMLSVRRTQPAKAATAGSLSSTATGRSSTGGVVSTTGIRGLDEENLRTAAFNEKAVADAEKHRVTPAAADTFAQAGGVTPRAVPPLTENRAKGGKK